MNTTEQVNYIPNKDLMKIDNKNIIETQVYNGNKLIDPYWFNEFVIFDQPNTKEYSFNNSLSSYLKISDDDQSLNSIETLYSKIDENSLPNDVLNKLDNIILKAEIDSTNSDSIISIHSIYTNVPNPMSIIVEDRQQYHNMNGKNFNRIVERFSSDVYDTCLFPLSLSMDGKDIYRGVSTWESINLLADCVLTLWTEQDSRINSYNSYNNGITNKVLCDQIKFLCLTPEFCDEMEFGLCKTLPLRRYSSQLDIKIKKKQNLFIIDDPELILENFVKGSETEVKKLAFKQELQDPKKMAFRLTKLEKQNYLRLTWREMMNIIFGKIICNNYNLKKMITFGQEVSYLVVCLVHTETSIEGQKQIIATIIEVAFFLFMRRNFQSFESVMRGLRLPQVYVLEQSWKSLKNNNPFHFKIYNYLSALIFFKSKNPVIYSIKSSLPNLHSFIEMLRVKSLSVLNNRSEERAFRWNDNKQIVDLMNQYYINECFIKQKIEERTLDEFRKKSRVMEKSKRFSFKDLIKQQKMKHISTFGIKKDTTKIDENAIKTLRMLAQKCFLSNQIPDAWTLISVKHLSWIEHKKLIKNFPTFFREFIDQIESYKFEGNPIVKV